MTEVWYDPSVLAFADLLAHGVRSGCAQHAWTTTAAQFEIATEKLGDKAHRLDGEPRPDKEPKYYLLQSPWRHVPMTAAQAARCNATLAPDASKKPSQWLSPRQVELHARIIKAPEREWPIAVDAPIVDAWAKLRD